MSASESSSTPSSGQQPSGRPGGYQRSASGLVGAMIILVLVVSGFLLFRGAVRDNPDAPPLQAVAYGQVVQPAAEQTGWPVVAPSSLPTGWIATSVRWQAPAGAFWHLGLLTDDEEYVGIEQSVSPVADMVDEFVGEDARAGGRVQLPEPSAAGTGGSSSTVAWQRWTGPDDDLALTTRIDGRTVLLVTSGTERQLRGVVGSLQLLG